jgi:hypothetical protein
MEPANARTYVVISAVIFGSVAVIHLLRAVNGWNFEVGPVSIPVGASWLGFAVTAALCAWAIRLVSARPGS